MNITFVTSAPTDEEGYALLKEDVYKRQQFELSSYKRLIDIYSSTAKTVDALMKLELPSGVEVEIKV